MDMPIKEKIASVAKKKILYLPHAVRQMSRPDRMITHLDVKEAILEGKVIEEYMDDPRGESCLICYIDNRPVHIVCSPKDEYLAIITAYLPDSKLWSDDFSKRIK
jgi:hypothetical protein